MSQSTSQTWKKKFNRKKVESNTSLLQNTQGTMKKLLEVTSNKMDQVIQAINNLREETRENSNTTIQNKTEVEAAIVKTSETIVKEH